MGRTARRVLVLDGHSRAAVETVQALGRDGIEVDVAGEGDCIAFHSRYPRQKLTQPAAHHPHKLAEWIALQDVQREYRLIVASTEFSLQAFRTLPDGDPVRAKALLPKNESLDSALHKHKTYELALRLGIPVPETQLIELGSQPAAVERYPVVLKPTGSVVLSSENIIMMAPKIVKNENDRAAILEKWLPYTALQQQQYVAGHGVGVEFLFNHGRKAWHFAHERVHEYPLTGGASTYRRSVHADPRLLDGAERLLTALRWHGVAMVEFKVACDGSFYLMEINPRLWGSLALPIDAGVNFPLGLWRIANNEPLPLQPTYRVPYYSRDLLNDLQWLSENITANHRDVTLLTQPRMRSFLQYLRPLSGKESWDHFDIRDLKVTVQILATIAQRYSKAIQRKMMERRRKSTILSLHRRAMRNLKHRSGPPRSLLFVCYGNICRSPVAEKLAQRALTNLEIESAGFYEQEGRHCPPNITCATRKLGVD